MSQFANLQSSVLRLLVLVNGAKHSQQRLIGIYLERAHTNTNAGDKYKYKSNEGTNTKIGYKCPPPKWRTKINSYNLRGDK